MGGSEHICTSIGWKLVAHGSVEAQEITCSSEIQGDYVSSQVFKVTQRILLLN